MTKVYLVYRGEYENRDVDSVHATLESAQAVRHDHGHTPVWEEAFEGWTCAWTKVHPAKTPVAILTFDTGTVKVVGGVATLPDGRTIETNAKYVSYPVLPEGADLSWSPGWTDSCDVQIVVRDLESTPSADSSAFTSDTPSNE